MEKLLEGYPVIIEIPFAWGEMDSLQHVNNIAYFRIPEGDTYNSRGQRYCLPPAIPCDPFRVRERAILLTARGD
jgi:hypothetical protein